MESRERYAERMRLSWAGWLAAVVSAAAAAGLSNFGDLRWWRIALSAAVFVVPLIGAWWLGRLRVSVAEQGPETWLHVDDAKLPASAVAEVQVLDPVAFSDALGAALHPLAFVVQRPWIRRGVRIVLDDPEDPTPYWVVSSRNPEGLREALVVRRAEVA
ncbi:DUF3093 domain-containing protein [Glycomyces sp. L485]|uniref:DUF3093 domain-containing protein n=1 Tax=Glycomyces sp. L485 TaxID=2909235 RepID=UPI001F4B738A|nr:DUF3093 domain-containing protein [Glycomyces sp. L485]MCH7232646.1 DUF3093 domain-containing protein [Glycomyces sp. L485]